MLSKRRIKNKVVKTRVQEGELIEKKQGTSSSRLSLFGKAGDQTMHSAKPFSGATFFNLLNNHNEIGTIIISIFR